MDTISQKCNCERVARVSAKCSDLCYVRADDKEHDGYVPSNMGIGEGDYIDFTYCLDCGKIKGKFPIPKDVVAETMNNV